MGEGDGQEPQVGARQKRALLVRPSSFLPFAFLNLKSEFYRKLTFFSTSLRWFCSLRVGKKEVLVARISSADASFPSSTRSASSSSPPPAAAPAAPKVHSAEQSAKNGEVAEETLTAPGTAEISSPASAHVPKKNIESNTQAPGCELSLSLRFLSFSPGRGS